METGMNFDTEKIKFALSEINSIASEKSFDFISDKMTAIAALAEYAIAILNLSETPHGFKSGDYIVSNNGEISKIERVSKDSYLMDLYGELVAFSTEDINTNYHLWTIADASFGDLIVNGNGEIAEFWGIENENGLRWFPKGKIFNPENGQFRNPAFIDIKGTRPASEEERKCFNDANEVRKRLELAEETTADSDFLK